MAGESLTILEEALTELEKSGYTVLPAIERCLELPQGTIERWRAGEPLDPEAVTLFRLLGRYPWLIMVAEGGYSPEASRRALFVGHTQEVRAQALEDAEKAITAASMAEDGAAVEMAREAIRKVRKRGP